MSGGAAAPEDAGPDAAAPTALSQFVYCWSAHGLAGTGYGVRAATADLQRLTGEDWNRYSAFCDYVPQSQRQEAGYESTAPLALARYRLPDGGYLIARKGPWGRRGTYFVHAIVDREGVIGPREIAASAEADFWMSSEEGLDAGETLLEPFPTARFAQAGAAELEDVDFEPALAELIAARAGNRPAKVAGEGKDALPTIRTLLTILPDAMADGICFSTYEARERPNALDLVAVGEPPPAVAASSWVKGLAEILREEPHQLEMLRRDPRITSLADLAELITARRGTLDAAALRAAVQSDSAFAKELFARRGAAEALVDAIDADPEWWSRMGLASLAASTLSELWDSPQHILRLAADRLDREMTASAVALVRGVYRRVRSGLADRRRDVEDLVAQGIEVAELAALMLGDRPDLDDREAARWAQFLVVPWSRLGRVLSPLPASLRPRILRHGIEKGEPDATPKLVNVPPQMVIEAVAQLAYEEAAGQRPAAFLVSYAMSHQDGDMIIQEALGLLPADFVRRELAPCVVDSGLPVTRALRRELLRAGTSDFGAFQRLVVEEPAAASWTTQAGQDEPTSRRSGGIFKNRR